MRLELNRIVIGLSGKVFIEYKSTIFIIKIDYVKFNCDVEIRYLIGFSPIFFLTKAYFRFSFKTGFSPFQLIFINIPTSHEPSLKFHLL